jgi:hypothetical protein
MCGSLFLYAVHSTKEQSVRNCPFSSCCACNADSKQGKDFFSAPSVTKPLAWQLEFLVFEHDSFHPAFTLSPQSLENCPRNVVLFAVGVTMSVKLCDRLKDSETKQVETMALI